MPEHDGAPANTAGAPLPQPQVDRASHWLPSLVWLLPLLAALVGIGLVAKSYFDEGPTVVVSFRSGEGLEAGKTKVKYKDVDVGQVRAISLSPDLSKVLVTIDMNKDARRFTAADTRFWVVKPRIGVSGVSGLGTLLSGAYIGVDAGKSKDSSHEFTGLEKVPQVAGDQKGTHYTLHGESLGSIDAGSPVFYRRIPVGQVISYELENNGQGLPSGSSSTRLTTSTWARARAGGMPAASTCSSTRAGSS